MRSHWEPLQGIPQRVEEFLSQVVLIIFHTIIMIISHHRRHQNQDHNPHHHQHHPLQAGQVTAHCHLCLFPQAHNPRLGCQGGLDGDDDDQGDYDDYGRDDYDDVVVGNDEQ